MAAKANYKAIAKKLLSLIMRKISFYIIRFPI